MAKSFWYKFYEVHELLDNLEIILTAKNSNNRYKFMENLFADEFLTYQGTFNLLQLEIVTAI